jgi:hypothetical protein
MNFNRNVLLQCLGSERLSRGAYQLTEIAWQPVEMHLAGFNLGKIQDVVDQRE